MTAHIYAGSSDFYTIRIGRYSVDVPESELEEAIDQLIMHGYEMVIH